MRREKKMLTSELLVTRVSKGRIEPVYAYPDQDSLDIARSVIGAFRGHVGKTYGDLLLELESFESINYRLIRGLSQILERRCLIEVDSKIDPVIARMAVFEESGGLVVGEEERLEALKRAAEKLSASALAKPTSNSAPRSASKLAQKLASKSTSKSPSISKLPSILAQIEPEDLEKALWADQEENLLVKEFRDIAAEDLLHQYNLSLAQTLLFRATGMEIQIEDNYQQLFWAIKRLGLMYSMHDGTICLDGPISLFKLTEKYGTAFAKLLPEIVASRRWSLKASIVKKTPQGKRVYDFVLDNTKRELFGLGKGSSGLDGAEDKPSFDSAVEKEFYQLSFHGWTVRREPAVLKSGKYAFIPDFSLEKAGARIYVEIVGFWTPEYLRHKIQKINHLENKENLILLVNRSLGCSGQEFQTENLIFYDRKIPQLEIIKILRRYEERQLKAEVSSLKATEISLDGSKSIIDLDDLASVYGVCVDALKEIIKDKGDPGYQLLGDQLVSRHALDSVQSELDGVKKHSLAVEIFERHGIKAHSQALELLGYRVKWSGLDPENAEIIRA